MSKFNSYARKVNDIATAAFEEYRKTEQAYKKAEEQARQYPQRHGMVDAQYAAKSARAQADFLEAKEAYRKAKSVLESHKSEIAALRKELVAELDDAYAADPAKLDTATMELLKSGVLKAGEFKKLMDQAQSDENYTMVRLIGKFASDAAVERAKKYGEDDSTARELRAIGYMSNQHDGNDVLQSFDYLVEVYDRSVDNPAMMQDWTDLTGEVVEEM